MKKFIAFICIFTLALSVVGCGTNKQKADGAVKPNRNISDAVKNETEENSKKTEQVITEAVFANLGDWALFLNESGPFTLMGENIEYYDIDGYSIYMDGLNNGDTVEIMSSGIMMESYPGQLADVTEVRVIKNGSEEDLEPYREILDELSSGMDGEASEMDVIPSMNVNYKTDLADTTMLVEHNFGYSWTVGGQAEIADAVGVFDGMEGLQDAKVPENTNLALSFSTEPISVMVERYDTENQEVAPEEVPVEQTENSYEITSTVSGLYLVHAEFQYGDVDYRFLVVVE